MTQRTRKNAAGSRRAMLRASALGLLAAEALPAQGPQAWSPKKQSAGGPIRSGHLLFLSGIGGWYPERKPKAGDIREQTADALGTMKTSLEKAGSSMENVLRVQVALVDPEANWGADGRGLQHVLSQESSSPLVFRRYWFSAPRTASAD